MIKRQLQKMVFTSVLVGSSFSFTQEQPLSSLTIDGATQERRLKVISCLEKSLMYGVEKGYKREVASALVALSDEPSKKVSALINVMSLRQPTLRQTDKVSSLVNLLKELSLSDLSLDVCNSLEKGLQVSWFSVARNTCFSFMATGMGILGTMTLLQSCLHEHSEQDFTQDQECSPFHRTGLMASVGILGAGVMSLCCIPCLYTEKQVCEQAYVQLRRRKNRLLEVHVDHDAVQNDLCAEVVHITQ